MTMNKTVLTILKDLLEAGNYKDYCTFLNDVGKDLTEDELNQLLEDLRKC